MAKIHFEDGFHGTYEAGNQTLTISKEGLLPYDMTYGALAGCLYSNFLKHLSTFGLSVNSTDVLIEGEKRKTVPATLEHVRIVFETDSDADLADLQGCLAEATKTCSMFQMISKVAEMEFTVVKK